MRFYMIKVREYGKSCDCADKIMQNGQKQRWCNHPSDKPLDRWHFWKPQGSRVAALYTDMAGVRRAMPHASRNWYAGKDNRKETKVVYFEDHDLLEVTEDKQLAFEQAEAKLLKVGELADEAERGAS